MALRKPSGNVYLVRGKDGTRDAWHYVAVDKVKQPLFQNALKSGALDVSQFGKIIRSGWGENPPPEVVEAMKNQLAKQSRSDP